MRVRVCSTRKGRSESGWGDAMWRSVNFSSRTHSYWQTCMGSTRRVLGPTLVYTSRIWPVTALHPMLKCHPALLPPRAIVSGGFSRRISCCCHCGPTGTGQRKCSCRCQSRPSRQLENSDSNSPCETRCPAPPALLVTQTTAQQRRLLEVPGNDCFLCLICVYLGGKVLVISTRLKADTVAVGSNLPLL